MRRILALSLCLSLSPAVFFVATPEARAQAVVYVREASPTDADTGYSSGPAEPDFPQVKFKKTRPPRGLQEMLDHLVQGISTDVPPEFDYYGYEIRRYMAHVGTDEVYQNQIRLNDELVNVKKARIILNYWEQQIQREKTEIEDAIQQDNASSTVRSTYKYNAGVVDAFQLECQSWIDYNEMMLDFLVKDKGLYKLDGNKLTFTSYVDRDAFQTLLDARNKARDAMHHYHTFSPMMF